MILMYSLGRFRLSVAIFSMHLDYFRTRYHDLYILVYSPVASDGDVVLEGRSSSVTVMFGSTSIALELDR